MGASTDARSAAPFPIPAHQTGRAQLRHPAFRPASPQNSRTRLHLDSAELQYPQLAKHRCDAKTVGAARVHLVTPPQEMPYALINVVTNRPIRSCPGSVAEVRRPAPQNLIQPVPHLFPGPRVAGHEKLSHLFLDACHRLLRRTCSQIPMAILLVAMRPECISQKVEALLARLLDAGLRL